MTCVLLVEDEPDIREMIRFALARSGFDILEAEDAKQARILIADQNPDIAIIDWMLPGTSGVELIRSLRREEATSELPVLMLTARAAEDDKVTGLDSGADDYLTKPVSIRELVARIHALLRRSSGITEDKVVRLGPIEMDVAAHKLLIHSEPVQIGPLEFKLLKFLITHTNRVYARSALIDQVWGQSVYIEERTVDVHVLRLRKVLKSGGVQAMLQTVHGVGYRFSASTDV